MYLPQSVPLARPHVAVWFGGSGKRYDFAVSRARPIWLGQPVVYVLVRYDGDTAVPLFVGRATAADPQLGGPGSEAIDVWEQAMALGMTHLHLRFEACTEADRAAEVEDLVAAISPPLNRPAAEPAGPETFAPAAGAVAVAAADVRVATAPEVPSATTAVRRAGWLWRTTGALAARYRRWRPTAPASAAETPAGHVTVRADAIVAEDRSGAIAPADPEPAASLELPPSVAVEATIALAPGEPAEGAIAAEPDHGRDDPRQAVRQRLGFADEDVVVLFAGELTWEAGADLAVDAMATVHADAGAVRLLLVGDGPLRAELEARAWHGGFAHACRFLGDLPGEAFAEVFSGCDAVVIPARSPQTAILAEHALSAGKPVLTTHQAQLGCVRHGENGLVTYDNPGSLVWGLRELRALVAQRRTPAALAA